jgi:hypothetical protein
MTKQVGKKTQRKFFAQLFSKKVEKKSADRRERKNVLPKLFGKFKSLR